MTPKRLSPDDDFTPSETAWNDRGSNDSGSDDELNDVLPDEDELLPDDFDPLDLAGDDDFDSVDDDLGKDELDPRDL